MTIDEFFVEYLNKTVGYPDGKYVGECLSLVKWFIKEVYGINPPASGCGGARCYWSIFPNPLGDIFEKIPNTDDFIPQCGDIMIWNGNAGGGYGHIGICTGEGDTNYFISFDQNWGGRHAHYVRHGYEDVYGVLRAKNNGGSMNISEELYGELVGKSSKYDEFVNIGYESAQQVKDLEEQRNQREQERNKAEDKVKQLEKEISDHTCSPVTNTIKPFDTLSVYKVVEENVDGTKKTTTYSATEQYLMKC